MGSILKQQINLQQVSPNSYTIAWHPDWAAGESLHGGHVAACLHHAATTYLTTSPDLIPKVNQPDVLKLHIEFLRQCERLPSTITITLLRTGAISSTLQLHLHQNDKLKVLALVTSTNFDKPVGPSAKSDWSLSLPSPLPVPDFKNCISPEKQKPDPNWLSGHLTATDFLSFSNRVTFLYPRAGYPVHGVCDNWYGFTDHSSDSSSASSEENVGPKKKEKIDSTYLALMADTIPSMSDTLLRNGGLYDAGHRYEQMKEWDERNPGKRYEMSASLLEAMTRSDTYISTVTLDVEYKRRVDESQGLEWMFSRSTTKMLRDGRMDIEVVMCDERMELVAVAQHLSLVLEAGRKFAKGGGKKKNNTSKGETKAML